MSTQQIPQLSQRQAYLCMYEFLRQHYERGPTDEIGALLGSLALLQDGGTADPAHWEEWRHAVRSVLAAEATSEGYTEAKFRLG